MTPSRSSSPKYYPYSTCPSPEPSPLLSERPAQRIPAPHAASEPAPCRYSPGTTNLRSSAFICGSFFAGAPDSKDSDRINRMDRINPSTDPVNPVHPVHSGFSFSAAPDNNKIKFIKVDCSNSALTSKPAYQQTDEANTDDTDRTDLHRYEIRAYPCYPCNPCSTAAASLFARVPDINCSLFIKNHHSLRFCFLPTFRTSP